MTSGMMHRAIALFLAASAVGCVAETTTTEPGDETQEISESTLAGVSDDPSGSPTTPHSLYVRGGDVEPGQVQSGPFPEPWERNTGPFPEPWGTQPQPDDPDSDGKKKP